MSRSPEARPNVFVTIAAGLALALAGAGAGWYWQSRTGDPTARLSGADRAAMEKVIHDYILEHPEILPEAMRNLEKRETSKQIGAVRGQLETPYPGAVLGNPSGKVTLVEFTDFACTYCRQSVADVEALVASDPDLRVVIRELPILSPQSGEAAKWGLAAAEQGKYAAFHRAMFAAGRPDPQTIEAAARAAGLDLDRARKTVAQPGLEAEIARNLDLARQLGFNGTPSWVVGNRVLSGAVGRDELAKAIAEAKT